jgi:hypothetical protein
MKALITAVGKQPYGDTWVENFRRITNKTRPAAKLGFSRAGSRLPARFQQPLGRQNV